MSIKRKKMVNTCTTSTGDIYIIKRLICSFAKEGRDLRNRNLYPVNSSRIDEKRANILELFKQSNDFFRLKPVLFRDYEDKIREVFSLLLTSHPSVSVIRDIIKILQSILHNGEIMYRRIYGYRLKK